MTQAQTAVTTSFWVIAGLALIWNLFGVMAYLADVMQSPADIAALEPAVQEMYATRPSWAVAAFAIAVFAGALGSVMLLMRKKLASGLFILSLVALVVQNYYSFAIARVHEKFADPQFLPLVVFVVAILLVWYARTCDSKGQLS